MLSKDLIKFIWLCIALTLYDLVRFSRENPQKIMILSELSLSIAANFEGESAYLIKQPRKHLLSL